MNAFKCIVMHIGHRGADTYSMNNTELITVQMHNDLGVISIQDLTTNTNFCEKAFKGLRILRSIHRAFSQADTKHF